MASTHPMLSSPISLYIHLPWCLHKCPYCDFNSHAINKNSLPEQQYVDCLISDLRLASKPLQDRTIQSIFFGGGTPSLFSPSSIHRILAECRNSYPLTQECEITLETNPGTFEYEKFAEFYVCGVNRLSIGVQSFNDDSLRRLERIHTSQEALMAIKTARQIGFDNINIDLMFGLPEQTINDAKLDIDIACQQPVQHISYYQLTLEPNTVFHRHPPPLPDDEICWQMQTMGIQALQTAGFARYEVSAYAQPGKQCIHNHNYWSFGDYLGIGAGAHSKVTIKNQVQRYHRPRQPLSYMQAVTTASAMLQPRILGDDDLVFEFMLNNLRLVGGFNLRSFVLSTGLPETVLTDRIDLAISDGLLEQRHDQIKATGLGYRFLDELTARFLPAA